jgi:choline dehydrogenase-like flavoprotein
MTTWGRDMLWDLSGNRAGLPAKFDVCIVGAGPAGITIARELRNTGLSVLLAETGGMKEVQRTDDLNRGYNVGHTSRMEQGRHRTFGGSSTRWGGRCAMLDPIDFDDREWIPKSGWPFSYESMLPYYEKAKTVCNFWTPWVDDRTALQKLGITMPALRTTAFNPYIWRVPPSYLKSAWRTWVVRSRLKAFDWAEAYGKDLLTAKEVHVLLNATLVELHASDDSTRVSSGRFVSFGGDRAMIESKVFVLCGSGIENARILLAAPAALQQRMNSHDTVGRFLMQHPRGVIASVRTNARGAMRLQKLFNMFQRPPNVPEEFEVGFALTDEAQRTNRLVNASAVLRYRPGQQGAWQALKALKLALREGRVRPSVIAKAAAGMLRLPVGNLMRRYLLGREVRHADAVIDIVIDLEQVPDASSRITLSNDTDTLGVCRAIVDWRISETERRTSRFFAEALKQEFERLDLGTVELAGWLNDGVPLTEEHLSGNLHYIGATRMSADPRDGVVDENGRVHGVENLYVAGASIFPTGGHANPTLTIVALSLRLAHHLADWASRDRRSPVENIPDVAPPDVAEQIVTSH